MVQLVRTDEVSHPAEPVDLAAKFSVEPDGGPNPEVAVGKTRDRAAGRVRKPAESDDLAFGEPQRVVNFHEPRHSVTSPLVHVAEDLFERSGRSAKHARIGRAQIQDQQDCARHDNSADSPDGHRHDAGARHEAVSNKEQHCPSDHRQHQWVRNGVGQGKRHLQSGLTNRVDGLMGRGERLLRPSMDGGYRDIGPGCACWRWPLRSFARRKSRPFPFFPTLRRSPAPHPPRDRSQLERYPNGLNWLGDSRIG